ncbi:nucleic acid binding protein [Actinidia seed borne latent virus]|uniref:Nucleic acid binding protein n=1 Tax=Actinidia seed borne latent virus TaxID=2560282 RepID=A0A2L0V1P5_9VIRU|nr:nucleic acid binding protein [Actinidia seed borne latent virus]AUZ97246.1 nucleic acid binding protein [Actinidia seed borne latent virus]UXL82945.1 nucleic acid binding protein [Actinidia seed borne latent virus]BBH55950.1 nucleic acid binding protein [Actinidia seed borne latent virus]
MEKAESFAGKTIKNWVALNKANIFLSLINSFGRDIGFKIFMMYKCKCEKEYKDQIRYQNMVNYGQGKSKSAMKRRAIKVEHCYKCGKFEHDGHCNKNQTNSNHEYLEMFRCGPIKLKAERALRKNSMVQMSCEKFGWMIKMSKELKEKANSGTAERV